MSTRLLTALLATLIVWLGMQAAVAEAATEVEMAVTHVDVSQHPTVQLEVLVPPQLAAAPLPVEAWGLSEEGRPRPLAVAGSDQPLTVLLVLDTSGSMRGAPVAAATAAVQQFVRDLPPNVSVGLVGFGDTPQLLAAPSLDRTPVLTALGGLEVRGETALYDAVLTGVDVLAGVEGRRRMILLSDGGDTVSEGTLEAATDAAVAAGTTVHAVTLATAESDVAALQHLADATAGGIAAATDPDALASMFGDLSALVARTRTITFTAEVPGSARIDLQVQAEDVVGRTSVRVDYPSAVIGGPARPAEQGAAAAAPEGYLAGATSGWLSRWGIAVGAAAVFMAAMVVGLLVVLRPARAQVQTTRSGGGLLPGVSQLSDRALGMTANRLRRSGSEERLSSVLRAAGTGMQPAEAVVLTITTAFVAGALGWLAIGIPGALLGVVVVLAIAMIAPSIAADRRRSAFDAQVGDVLQLLAGNLRAGFGLLQALSSVSSEVESPASEEFDRVVAEARLGRDVDESLGDLATRMQSTDLDWAVQAMAIHREVGGDLAHILDQVAGTIRERARIRGQIKALSAEGRISAAVLLALPVGMTAFMWLRSPEYIGELTKSSVGFALIGGAVLLLAVGGVWLANIIKVRF